MGRKKIEIKLIKKTRQRAVTMIRRREGLFKKAYELSELCDCNVAIICLEPSGKCNVFSTTDMDTMVKTYRDMEMEDQVVVHKVTGEVTFSEDIVLTRGDSSKEEETLRTASNPPSTTTTRLKEAVISDKLGGRSASAPGAVPLFSKKRKSITLNMFNLNTTATFGDGTLLTPSTGDIGTSASLAGSDLGTPRFGEWRPSTSLADYKPAIANAAEDFTLALISPGGAKHAHTQPSTPIPSEKRTAFQDLIPGSATSDISLDSAYYPGYFSPAYLHSPTRGEVSHSGLYPGSPIASPSHTYAHYDAHTPGSDSIVDSYMSADPLHSIYSPQSLAFPK